MIGFLFAFTVLRTVGKSGYSLPVGGREVQAFVHQRILLSVDAIRSKPLPLRRSIRKNISPEAVTESNFEPVTDSAAAVFFKTARRRKYSIFPEGRRRFSRSEK